MMPHSNRAFAAAIALSLSLGLAACGSASPAGNRSLNSVHQPVVETSTYALDLAAGAGGLPLPEQRRLGEWFSAMEVGYGDRIAVDGTAPSDAVRADVAAIAARHGLLLSDAAPVTAGAIAAGSVRVTISRAGAHVPGCPDWAGPQAASPGGGTTANYGCAVNSNIAAMVADPQHLIHGATDTGHTEAMSASKAIAAYREKTATGSAALSENATGEESGQ